MMSLKSKYLKEFITEIKYKNRNPKDIKALTMLDELETNPVITLSEGTILFRARTVTKGNQSKVSVDSASGFFGFDESGSFITPVENTRDMRANYRYIPYLYCANSPYLAVIEVRPRLGANVSIASIEVRNEIHLLDFTGNGISAKKSSDAKKNLFSDLSDLYSVPVTDEDDVIDYIPTQYIAEYAKNLGYDGISFSSSLAPDAATVNPPMYNIVLFNYYKAKAIRSNLCSVTNNHFEIEQADSDLKKLDVRGPLELILEELSGAIGL